MVSFLIRHPRQKIYKNEFGSFCSQFGFNQKETMPLSKQKPSRKPSKDKFYHSKRGTYDNYRMNDTKQSRHVQRRVNKDTQKKVDHSDLANPVKATHV